MGSRYKEIFKFLMDNYGYSKVRIKAYELLYNMSRFGVWFFQRKHSWKTALRVCNSGTGICLPIWFLFSSSVYLCCHPDLKNKEKSLVNEKTKLYCLALV